MEAKSEKFNHFKKLIRAYLISAPKGLTLQALRSDFKSQEGKDLPYIEFGYPSPSALILDLKDIVESSFNNGVLYLRGKADKDTCHIKRMIAAQKDSKTSRFSNSFPKKYSYKPPPLMLNSPNIPQFVNAQIKTKVLNLLGEFKDGVSMDNFNNAWKVQYGNSLDSQQHGFRSVEELCKSISQIVIVKNSFGLSRLYLKDEGARSKNSPQLQPCDLGYLTDSYSETTAIEKATSSLSSFVKNEFLRVLRQNPYGIWASTFCHDYEKLTGKPLFVSDLGYFSVMDLADTHPEIFRKEKPVCSNGEWLLFEKGSTLPTTSPSTFKDPLVEVKVSKALESVSTKCSLADFHKIYLKVNGELLPPNLSNETNLKKFFVENHPNKIYCNNLEGNVIVSKPASRPHSSNLLPLCSPNDIVKSDRSFKKIILDEVPKDDDTIEIRVSQVYSPSMFWFFLNGECYSDALELLMDELEDIYYGFESKWYTMPDSSIMIGHVCAAIYPDDKNWHRCIVTGIRDSKHVEVTYVDYGTTGLTLKSNLRFLKEKFMDLPAQAMNGSLAKLAPFNGDAWSEEAGTFFFNVSTGKILLAKLHYISSLISSLYLCDTSNPNEDVYINDELVHLGYAKFVELPSPVSTPLPQQLDSKLSGLMINDVILSEVEKSLSNANPLVKSVTLQLIKHSMSGNQTSNAAQSTPKTASSDVNSSSFNLDPKTPSPDVKSYSFNLDPKTPSPDVKSHSFNFDRKSPCFDFKSAADSSPIRTTNNEQQSVKRYVKRVILQDDITIHIINFIGSPYIAAGEISSLFWKNDNLRKILRLLDIKVPLIILDQQEYPTIFQHLTMFDVPGIKEFDGESVKEIIFIYPLRSVPEIVEKLKHKSVNLREDLENEYRNFNPDSPYWKGEEYSEFDEQCACTDYTFEELKSILNCLYTERKDLIRKILNDEQMKGSDKLKQIEDQIDIIKLKISELKKDENYYQGSSNHRLTPDGASMVTDLDGPD